MSDCELTFSFERVSEKSPPNLSACVSENSPPHFSVCVNENSPPDFSVWVSENSSPHLCLWVRERPHLPSALPSNHTSDNLLVNSILDGRTDGHTRFSAKTLNPKPGHTQEDTHYTECYPDIEGYPLHWVIPITDTPKRIPITLSDTLTLRDTHYTEWYPLRTHPRGYPLHWVIPWHWGIPWNPLHWVIPITDTRFGWERTAVWQGKDRLTNGQTQFFLHAWVVVVLPFHHLLHPGIRNLDDRTDGWKGSPPILLYS